MLLRIIITLLAISFLQILAQEQVKSEAYKKNGFTRRTSLLKPKYPSYSLVATFVLKEKAKKGDPFAQHELGIRYILGIGVPIDSVSASYWIGKAANKNLPAANFNYAIMLNNGVGCDWNPFKAFKNFRISAESGMEQAQYVLGLLYTDNLIVNKNLYEAQKWFNKSASKGFEEAKKILKEFEKQGLLIQNDSVDTNSKKSKFSSINKAASFMLNDYELDFYNFNEDSLSEVDEIELLNDILKSNNDKLKKMLKVKIDNSIDDKKDTTALDIINYAAKTGSPEALLINARLMEYGIGRKKDLICAASNYLKAFRLGSYKAAESLLKISRSNLFYKNLEIEVKDDNPEAMYVWAGLIALGMDYSLTEEQAFDLLKKAEKQNHINAVIELGLAYYSGSLVEKDSIKALKYLNIAEELGSSEAKIRIAFIRIKDSNNVNSESHIATLDEYSKKGSVLAEAAYAYCYENGIKVLKNKAKAAKLYRQAAQRGNEAAYNSLRNMYDSIRPNDEEFQIVL